MKFLDDALEAYVERHTTPEPPVLERLVEASGQSLEYIDMISGRQVGRLLQLLIRIGGYRRVLEVGTFTGYSAISMADALPDDGELITLEANELYASISRPFFEMEPYNRKIRQIMGFARKTILTLEGLFDLVFLDADKNAYPDYVRMIKPLIRPGGVLVVDNVLWSGKVIVPGDEKESIAIDRTNRMIQEDADFENLLLPVRDGVMVAYRK